MKKKHVNFKQPIERETQDTKRETNNFLVFGSQIRQKNKF